MSAHCTWFVVLYEYINYSYNVILENRMAVLPSRPRRPADEDVVDSSAGRLASRPDPGRCVATHPPNAPAAWKALRALRRPQRPPTPPFR